MIRTIKLNQLCTTTNPSPWVWGVYSTAAQLLKCSKQEWMEWMTAVRIRRQIRLIGEERNRVRDRG